MGEGAPFLLQNMPIGQNRPDIPFPFPPKISLYFQRDILGFIQPQPAIPTTINLSPREGTDPPSILGDVFIGNGILKKKYGTLLTLLMHNIYEILILLLEKIYDFNNQKK